MWGHHQSPRAAALSLLILLILCLGGHAGSSSLLGDGTGFVRLSEDLVSTEDSVDDGNDEAIDDAMSSFEGLVYKGTHQKKEAPQQPAAVAPAPQAAAAAQPGVPVPVAAAPAAPSPQELQTVAVASQKVRAAASQVVPEAAQQILPAPSQPTSTTAAPAAAAAATAPPAAVPAATAPPATVAEEIPHKNAPVAKKTVIVKPANTEAGHSARHAASHVVDDLARFEESTARAKHADKGATTKAAEHAQLSDVPKGAATTEQVSAVTPTTAATATPTGVHAAERSASSASTSAVNELKHFESATRKGSQDAKTGVKAVTKAENALKLTEAQWGKKDLLMAKSIVDWLAHDMQGGKCDTEFERQQCGHLYCATNSTCQYCTRDDHCHSPRYRCFGEHKSQCQPNEKCECHHKNLFPLASADLEAMVLAFVACALAASGGIGGGGLLVPLFILVEDFEADLASPLSSATITGGAIVGYIIYCTRWHPLFPTVQGPLIDYETVLIILPSLLTGTMIGTIFDKILPLWFIMTMLFILLGFSTYRTCKKGLEAMNKEGGGAGTESSPEHDDEAMLENSPEILPDSTRFPRTTITLIVIFWAFILLIALLKGGHHIPSVFPFVSCNNTWYWVLHLFCWTTMFIMSGLVRYKVLNGGLEGKGDTQWHDILWTPKNTITLPLICLPSGICAGLLGVGGGMVVGPLLLELGARPSAVSATSTFTVLVTASSSAMQFVLLGKLPVYYAFFFALIGGAGTLAGQLAVERIIKRYNSTSIIVFGISAVIFMSTVMMGYTGIRAIVRIAEVGGNMGLRNLCD